MTNTLITNSEDYARYFEKAAADLYVGGTGYHPEDFPAPKWKEFDQALMDQAKALEWRGKHHVSQLTKKRDDVFMPIIGDWLHARSVTKLAPYHSGSTSSVFEEKTEYFSDMRTVVRLGPDGTNGTATVFKRAWCPLGLQSYTPTVAQNDRQEKILMEALPLVVMLNTEYELKNFGRFLNDCVLTNTPYTVKEHKDLGQLKDGTPVYVDPGSLNFASEELAEEFAERQFDPAWQQEIMAIIHANCEKLNLPEPLRWVVRGADGKFVTKQSVLYPNPWPNRPAQTIELKSADLRR